ncbi:MAG: CARDB domain-containing protein [archaeon]
MRFNAERAVFCTFLVFALLLNISVVAGNVSDFQIDSTSIQVYRDGLVRVTQSLTVNETVPVISFPLVGSGAKNFVVLDENQTVLDYELTANNLTVYTLGTTSVSVQYDTHSLTLKDAEVWTFLVNSPYNLTVVLPEDSTIVYLNNVPDSIDTTGNTVSLSLFASQWEISYTFPLNPPANFLTSNLVVSPAAIKPNEEVTVTVTVSNIGGQTGSYTVPLIINQIQENSKLVTLNKDESTTVEFKVTKQTLGTYNINVDGLVHTFTVTGTPSEGKEVPSGETDSFPIEYLIVVAVVVGVLVIIFVLFRRKGPNIEKVFEKNPQLNREEKDVLNYLAANDGKAFESEIRKKFPDIPRTSLWRLIKRLERLEIVKVEKIGLENQVELKK